jgi:hypothetical protein
LGVLLSEYFLGRVELGKKTLTGCSPEETVKEDVRILRESIFFKGQQIVGLVQDTETGLLKEVVWEE